MSKPIKIGIVGLGRIGMTIHRDAYAARPDKYTVVAACDLIESRTQKYADKFGCRTYTSIEEFLADPEIEIVDIATRSNDHYAHAKMALLAGKSVLLEKPFCETYAEARELVELGSQPAGPRLYIRHNRRFEEGFIKISGIIDSGILGNVFEIRLARNNFQRRNDWQAIKEFGGGQLLNWGPHIIDHTLRFAGGDYVEMFSNIKRVTAAGDAEDHIKIVMKGVNGRIVDMEISGGLALKIPEYVVYGTRGSLICQGRNITLKYIDPTFELPKIVASPETPKDNASFGNKENFPWIEETIELAPGDNTDAIWDALYDSYRNNVPYPIPNDQALKVVEVIEKAKKGTEFAK